MQGLFQVPFAGLLTHITQSWKKKEKNEEWKFFAAVFGAIFVARMADKTQFVTLLFAAASAIGALLSQVINARMMSMIAGAGFIVIGGFTLWHG